jgi:hypothetical protein
VDRKVRKVRNVVQGETGLTWKGLPVAIGKTFRVNGENGKPTLMVPITVIEEDGKQHRRNVLVHELERRK